ncbi:MAG TPA: potassium-transporting ATPase subunit KdpA, partial [Gaiellaceae bacterium]|nr:potassium-transporting ATPase subunit KdpA [Gaiellaceae bacterium]
MSASSWLQAGALVAIVVASTRLLGPYLARVYAGGPAPGDRAFLPVERLLYRAGGIDAAREQSWPVYARSLLAFGLVSVLALYALQRLQGVLPLNPTGAGAVPPALAFNTAVSFATNTNWQNYAGESTMSHLTQMAGLTVQNFVSAATGIVLAIALIRGFARRSAQTVGNFWVDLVRCTLYLLLPISIVVGLFLVWQGVPQNLNPYVEATTLEGAKQVIAQGPVASQEVIKELGTNGGGFFNANSAHPYENPNALTNLVELLLIFSIGAALTNVFGRMVGDQRQGWAILAVMGILFLAGVATAYSAEAQGNPA